MSCGRERSANAADIAEVDGREGKIAGYWSGAEILWGERTKAAAGLDPAGRPGILHIDGVRDRLALLEIADDELPDREGIAAAIGTHDVEGSFVNVQLFDHGGWPAEVCTAAGWKILVIGAASNCRQNDMKARNVDQTHSLAKEYQVEPGALNHEMIYSPKRGKVRRGVSPQGEACGDESRSRKVDTVIMINFDLAREDSL